MKAIRLYNYRDNKYSKQELKTIVYENLKFDARIGEYDDLKVEINFTHQNKGNNIRKLSVFKKGSTSLLAELDLIDEIVYKYNRGKLTAKHKLNPDWLNNPYSYLIQ